MPPTTSFLRLGPRSIEAPLSESGRRGSNPRHQAWKACALPTELLPRTLLDLPEHGGGRIRTFEGVSRQIYSLLPLAAWVPHPRFTPAPTAGSARLHGLLRSAKWASSG